MGRDAGGLAVLAGATITLLTRMQSGTDSDVAKIIAAVGIAFVIVGGGLCSSPTTTGRSGSG